MNLYKKDGLLQQSPVGFGEETIRNICLFLKEKSLNPSEIDPRPPRLLGDSLHQRGRERPMSRSTIAARFESCLGSEESFTGLFLERTVGVCHLIQPPTEGQSFPTTNK